MGTKEIAEWLFANPQAWFQLAEYIAEKNWEYAEQLADTFGDMACNYAPALDDGQPSEQQEWQGFDPDC
jgi:hypothetical protein